MCNTRVCILSFIVSSRLLARGTFRSLTRLPTVIPINTSDNQNRIEETQSCGQTLEEDSEVDDGYNGCDHHFSGVYYISVNNKDEREGDRTSEAAVGHNELFDATQTMQTEPIGHSCQSYHSYIDVIN